MDRTRIELESIYNMLLQKNRVHCVASYYGSHRLRSGTSKVLFYDVACNSCALCDEFEIQLNKKQISESDYRVWVENYNYICLAQYSKSPLFN